MKTDVFALRHIGPREAHCNEMLQVVGATSIEELISETVPDNIRLQSPLNLEAPLSEQEYLEHIHQLASKNKVYKSYIGMGYHPSNLPRLFNEIFWKIQAGTRLIRPTKLRLLKAV